MVILKIFCEVKKNFIYIYFIKKSGSYHELIMKEENLTLWPKGQEFTLT